METPYLGVHQTGSRPVIGFSLVSIDITEENRLKNELREERDYANAVLDSLPGVFYHYDSNLRLQRWNRNLERVTGYVADDLHGFDPLNFFVDDEKPRVAEAIRGVFETGQGMIEADYLLKDGGRIPYLFTGVKFNYNGEQGFVGTGADISERKLMEVALRDKNAIFEAIVDVAPDGILILDPEGNRITHNKRLNELFGTVEPCAEAGQLLRNIERQISHPAGFMLKVKSLQADPRTVKREVVELADGTLLMQYTAPLCDPCGKHHGRIWAFLVTNRREDAAERRGAAKHLA